MGPSQTPVIIISGFLGAGKTTLINKLLKGALSPTETVLIENEFGEVSIDDDLLSDSGITMKTMASGCICCTLSGNLISEIPGILDKYHPQAIIVEPTGMACPNDLLDIFRSLEAHVPIKVTALVSVINAQNIERVIKMNIPVFSRQFESVSYVLMTHTDGMLPDEVRSKVDMVREKVGPDVRIIVEPLESIDGLRLLTEAELAFGSTIDAGGEGEAKSTGNAHSCEHDHEPEHECDNDRGHEHEHQHNHGHHHYHDHSQFGNIATKAYYPIRAFTEEELRRLLDQIDEGRFGTIVRAKGFLLESAGDYVHLEQVPGSCTLSQTHYAGPSKLVVIGRDIDEVALSHALGL